LAPNSRVKYRYELPYGHQEKKLDETAPAATAERKYALGSNSRAEVRARNNDGTTPATATATVIMTSTSVADLVAFPTRVIMSGPVFSSYIPSTVV
jgi:hypothetical protein